MQYYHFVKDFPGRCHQILERFEKNARLNGLEVTMMLSIAAAGIIIPFERFRLSNQKGPIKDRDKFRAARDRMDQLQNKQFLGSELCQRDSEAWSYGRLSSESGDPNRWKEWKNLEPLKSSIQIKEILHHLRNALAHGNICTLGDDEIEAIGFIAQPVQDGPYYYLHVEPDSFRIFLESWFTFLKGLPIPHGIQQQSLQLA